MRDWCSTGGQTPPVETYTHGPQNLLTKVTNPLGFTSTSVYDTAGRQVASVDPLGYRSAAGYVRQGGLFLFINLRRNRVKLMYWDRDGIAIWQKRLEQGSLQHPQPRDDAKYLVIDDSELHLLLVGIELSSVKRRKRYVVPELPTTAPV